MRDVLLDSSCLDLGKGVGILEITVTQEVDLVAHLVEVDLA